MKNKYETFCVGCGLCNSEFGYKEEIVNGFHIFKSPNNKDNYAQLKNICPLSNKVFDYLDNNIWGKYHSIYLGWSNNPDIRFKASSGGAITSIACFLLENNFVDEIIQIKENRDDPLETEVVCNKNKEEILRCMGSRYTNSSILKALNTIVDEKKIYALVGRPCDILVLKNYQKKYHKYNNIKYTIAFFCAGTPSLNANVRMLNEMGISDINNCKSIRYRGYGWPGKAIATSYDGKEYQMDYIDSWGKYLGRDIRKMCRFCIDGCGSAADISCGDYWDLDNNEKPIFKENNDGKNLIIIRTDQGKKIIKDAFDKQEIFINEVKDYNILKKVQPSQYERTTTVFDKVLASKLFLKEVPEYDISKLWRLAKNNSFKKRFKFFGGTIKRIIKGKI